MLRLPLLILVLALGAAPAAAQEALAIGGSLPLADRAMVSAGGGTSSFAQTMGPRGLAVVFWANTCPWVQRYEGRIMELAEEYGAAGVGFLLVNPNDPTAFAGDNLDAMRTRAQERGYPMAYAVDAGSEAARAFGATRTPQVFLFDDAGTLIYEGTVDDSPSSAAQARERYFRDALAALVAGEAPVVERTRAFGCTIKFPGE
jgi:thiol-disulfide isomerase/thioredoxin